MGDSTATGAAPQRQEKAAGPYELSTPAATTPPSYGPMTPGPLINQPAPSQQDFTGVTAVQYDPSGLNQFGMTQDQVDAYAGAYKQSGGGMTNGFDQLDAAEQAARLSGNVAGPSPYGGTLTNMGQYGSLLAAMSGTAPGSSRPHPVGAYAGMDNRQRQAAKAAGYKEMDPTARTAWSQSYQPVAKVQKSTQAARLAEHQARIAAGTPL